nr:response regulator [Bacteroidales bacterium]
TIGIILMDIKLPGIDGFEATRQIREFNDKVPIIGQTAYALVGDRSKVLAAGCDDYLSKPIDKNELFQIINKHI